MKFVRENGLSLFFGLIFLRTAPDVDAREAAEALTALWGMYRDLKAGRLRDLPGVELPFEEDKTTVLLGFGRNAFELDGISESRPDGLGDEFLFRSALPTGGGPTGCGTHRAGRRSASRTVRSPA